MFILTVKSEYGTKTRRRLNLLYIGRSVGTTRYNDNRWEITRWLTYGAKPGGWVKPDPINRGNIVALERVDPVPAWIAAAEAERSAK